MRAAALLAALLLSAQASASVPTVAVMPFKDLSGGQHQRTFLARALAQQADVYFMDEPFAGVDAATERAIFALLVKLREQGKTVLVVHHDLRTVQTYFDQVVLLNVRLVAAGATRSRRWAFRPSRSRPDSRNASASCAAPSCVAVTVLPALCLLR